MMKTQSILTTTLTRTLPICVLAVALSLASTPASAKEKQFREGGKSDFKTAEKTFETERETGKRIEPKTVRSRVQKRFDALTERISTTSSVTEDFRLRKERIFKTRDYLFGLVDLGTPEILIDTWSDALVRDEIVVGMPAELIANYWGEPIATETVVLAGVPAKVWTYRVRPGKTEKITIVENKVRTVVRG